MPRTHRSASHRATNRHVRRPRTVLATLAGAALASLSFVPAADADVTFRAPVSYATGGSSIDVAIADLNGDGHRDLITANAGNPSFSVLLGQADGTFGSEITNALSAPPASVDAADFDGDGNLDLVFALPSANQFVVRWGIGDGSFTATVTTGSTQNNPRDAVGADLDGDGRADVVTANYNAQSIQAFVADGSSRTFVAGAAPLVGNGPNTLAAGPIFTASDILVTNHVGGNMRAMPGDGVGGFQVGATYGVGRVVPDDSGLSAPNAVAVGDVNGDGRLDAVTSNFGTNSATVLYNTGSGFFTIQQNTVLPAGSLPSGIATGDFTGDGRADAAVIGRGTDAVTVMRWGGATNLPMQTVGTYTGGTGLQRAAAADFNGDGAADLAIAADSGAVRVLLSQGHPALAGQASASVAVPGSLTDTVTLAGGTPNATGTITFRLYGPGDTSCATPLATQTRTVAGLGAYANPTSFTATSPGTYRWVASYSGDTTNDAVVGTCSDANQTTVVTKATPTVAASATSSVTAGTPVTPSATLSGGYGPTGSLTLRAYETSDCSGSPLFTSDPLPVSGNGTYPSSSAYTPTSAGTVRWVASYGGDGSNDAVSSACGASETTVTKVDPTLSLTVPTPIVVGVSAASPTAALADGYAPTGTVSFTVYADAACTVPVHMSLPATVTGNGSYSPPPGQFAPTDAGTYHWVARYSGDDANEPRSTVCGAVGTTLTVLRASPTIAAAATTAVGLGDAAPATATLDDSWTASGPITLSAYATADCSGPPAYVSDPVAADGDGTYDATPAFVPPHAGPYRWVAAFAGDDDNDATASACGAPGSVTEVAPFTPDVTGAATSAMLGEPVEATATLADATEGAAGTITFTAFADATCTGPAAFTSAPVTVDGNGEYGSDRFVPGAPGDYRWVARYSGDGDNEPAATACGAPGLTSTIVPRPVVPQPPIPSAPPVTPAPLLPVPPVVTLSRVTAPRCLPASAPGRRGSIHYGVSSRSRVTFTVQRRTNSPWPIRTSCPRPLTAKVSGETAGKYVTVRGRATRIKRSVPLRRTVTVARGTHRIALRTLLGSARLAPGRYRVLIEIRSAAGATTRGAAYLWVLRP